MESQEQPVFISNSDFWISEIRGNIARLNDAAAVVETDIVLPSATNNRLDIQTKVNKIRDFQLEMRRLYKNTRQVLDANRDIKMRLWLKKSSTAITDIQILKDGIDLANDIQDFFYDTGIKDIDVSGPVRFPFSYYADMVGVNDGTATE